MKVEIDMDVVDELREEIDYLKQALADQTYMGNSIGYTYNKMETYGKDTSAMGRRFKEAVIAGHIKLTEHDDWIAKRLDLVAYQRTQT